MVKMPPRSAFSRYDVILSLAMLASTVGALPRGTMVEDNITIALETAPSYQRRDVCPQLVGNADLYGVGIRLGVYFQLVASLLANHYHPEMLKEALSTNAIFLTAVFIATVRAAAIHQLDPVEGVIMLQLLLSFLLSVFTPGGSLIWKLVFVASRSGYVHLPHTLKQLTSAHFEGSMLGGFTRRCLRMAIASFQLFFWFKFVHYSECHRHVFLVSNAMLNLPVIRFFQGLSVVYGLYVFFRSWATIVFVIGIHARVIAKVIFHATSFTSACRLLAKYYLYVSLAVEHEVDTSASKDSTEVARKRLERRYGKGMSRLLDFIRILAIIYGIAIILWSILTVELTLRFNFVVDIDSLGTTGQLIPFVIGLTGLLRTLHRICVFALNERKKAESTKLITLDRSTGTFKYCLRNGRIAQFKYFAEGHPRRRSLDAGNFRANPEGAEIKLSISSSAEPMLPPQLLEPRLYRLPRPRQTLQHDHSYDFDLDSGTEDDNSSIARSRYARSDWSTQLADDPPRTLIMYGRGPPPLTTNKYLPKDCVFRSQVRNEACKMEIYRLRNGQGQPFIIRQEAIWHRRASTSNIRDSYTKASRISATKLEQLCTPDTRKEMKLKDRESKKEKRRDYRNARKRYGGHQLVPNSMRWIYTLANGDRMTLNCPDPRSVEMRPRRASWHGEIRMEDSHDPFTEFLARHRVPPSEGSWDSYSYPRPRSSRWSRVIASWRRGLLEWRRLWRGLPSLSSELLGPADLSRIGKALVSSLIIYATSVSLLLKGRLTPWKGPWILCLLLVGLCAAPLTVMCLLWAPVELARLQGLEDDEFENAENEAKSGLE